MGLSGTLFSQAQKTKQKKSILKKFLIFTQKIFSYIYSKIFFLYLLKNFFLIFQEIELFKKTCNVSGGNFSSSKNKKNLLNSEKNYNISGNGTF